MLDPVIWRPGRSAVEQTALMQEHSICTRYYDEQAVVIAWSCGDAMWGPCPECVDA